MDKLPSVRILGISLSAFTDEVSFNASILTDDTVLGKRTFLSKISKLFERLGFLTPFVIRAKILMKRLWVLEIDWDKELTKGILESTKKFFTHVEDFGKLKICRCLKKATWFKPKTFTSLPILVKMPMQQLCLEEINVRMELFHFHWLLQNEKLLPKTTQQSFLTASTVLVLHLCQAVSQTSGDHVVNNWNFWCNSMIILYWIKNHSRKFSLFYENRIWEIHTFLELK